MERSSADGAESSELTLREVVRHITTIYAYLKSKWLLLLTAALIGILAGFAIAKTRIPLYSAVTTFVLEDGGNNSGIGQYSGIASLAGVDLGNTGGGIFQGDNIIELYKSRRMVQKTLLSKVMYQGKLVPLISLYFKLNPKERFNEMSFNVDSNYVFTRKQDSILGKAVEVINRENLGVSKLDKKLNIIKVEVKSPDEFFSKAFNDQIVENVNDFYVQTKTKKSQETVQLLQQKTSEIQKQIYGSIITSAQIADATPNLNPTRSAQRTAPIQRSMLSAEANKALLGQLIQSLESARFSLRQETPLIQVIDTPIFPLSVIGLSFFKAMAIGAVAGFILAAAVLILRWIFLSALA